MDCLSFQGAYFDKVHTNTILSMDVWGLLCLQLKQTQNPRRATWFCPTPLIRRQEGLVFIQAGTSWCTRKHNKDRQTDTQRVRRNASYFEFLGKTLLYKFKAAFYMTSFLTLCQNGLWNIKDQRSPGLRCIQRKAYSIIFCLKLYVWIHS